VSRVQPRAEIGVPVEVAAPADVVWRVATDWERQGEWMLATRVEMTGGDGRSPGSSWRATTGVGPVAVVDPMEIVSYVEGGPWRCVVRHTGRVVRGDGVFEVESLGPERARFVMTERLDLPLGAAGRAGWPLLRPAFRAGLALSLRRLARLCEAVHRYG
jgi:hypothetical protein